MSIRKKVVWVAGIVVVLGVLAGPLLSKLPLPQVSPVDGGNFVGVNAGGSFAWVIPTQNGVVLIDTGGDVAATALKEEIAGRTVLAILITHGHFDHIGGLPFFPNANIYIGPGEAQLLQGEVLPIGWIAKMATSIIGPPPYSPPNLMTIIDGGTLEIDGETFFTLHTPGHTSGSVTYIWQDVLFTGDSIIGRGGYVSENLKGTADDYGAIRGNVAKVLNYSFDRIADGHVGLHQDAFQQVEAYIRE